MGSTNWRSSSALSPVSWRERISVYGKMHRSKRPSPAMFTILPGFGASSSESPASQALAEPSGDSMGISIKRLQSQEDITRFRNFRFAVFDS